MHINKSIYYKYAYDDQYVLLYVLLQEIAIPVYTLGLLVAIKYLIPNPNFPPVTVPQESPDMYNYLYGNITVAPSTKHVQVKYSV